MMASSVVFSFSLPFCLLLINVGKVWERDDTKSSRLQAVANKINEIIKVESY